MYCCHKRLNSERIFQPNYKSKPLSVKFYARHDNSEIARKNVKHEYFVKEIEKRIKFDCRDEFYAPITTNQTYGWLERSADKYTGLDKEILVHNTPYDHMMHVMKEIAFDIHRHKR